MKYTLKTGNYKTFETFKKNVMFPRSYFIPFSSVAEFEKTDFRNERYNSSMVDCLSGEWEFIYYKNCLDIPNEFDTDNVEFDKISVPCVWQHTGYETPYYVNTRYQFKPNPPEFPIDCPAGVYRKIINIESEQLNYYLCFLGVAGAFDLFVNGSFVGYNEGSHNTAEFELNDFLNVGENEIVLVLYKWSNATYLECQDMFRCNGIFRDVLLYKTNGNSLYDFEAKTDFIDDGVYNLCIKPSLKLTSECSFTAFIYDESKLISSKSIDVSPDSISEIIFEALEVKEWSAECPYLYDIILVISEGEDIVEVVRRSVGFKHIEIKGNVFYFNNRPIKLLGVNHHDTNSEKGYVLSIEEMERDVKTIKEYNANCVRTSHYPPDPSFIDLCDAYGIYVVDEADIETHGCEVELHRPGACSHNPDWKEHYWDRVYRMFERDKNHPAVTMWSLGNEAHGYSNQDYCYNELKKRTDIPIHYEAVCRTKRWAYDVLSHMYTFPAICEKIAKGHGLPSKYYKKPFYLCEYAHAMGVGAGELERYVKCFYSANNMLGGCIWEFADHAIYHKDGKYKYTYGGDHGEWKHDGNFCVDGLFYPDRMPHSGALQMKNCYRPVRAEKISSSSYSFFNHRYFEKADMTVNYTILSDAEVIANGSFEISVNPQASTKIDIDKAEFSKSSFTVIQFEYIENDFTVAKEEIELSAGEMKLEKPSAKAPTVQESEKRLFIQFENGRLIFDKKSCFIDSYIYAGKEMISPVTYSDFHGLGIQLYRAPLDNDMYINLGWEKCRLAQQSTFNSKCEHSIESDCVKIEYFSKIATPVRRKLAGVQITLRIYGDGSIKTDCECVSGRGVCFAPRFGIQLEMPREFDNVKYFGLGPVVNLPDFKEHALTGVYTSSVSSMREDYIKPQESATRCGTRFAEITDDDGVGLRFEAVGKAFVFSANAYTPQQCAKAKHREDLSDNTVCINIDSHILGAGSNSCGPVTSKQYRLGKLKGKKLSFVIKPIGGQK